MKTQLSNPADVKNPLDRLTAAADRYRQAFGWDTSVSGQNVLVTLGGQLGGVVLPGRYVHRVQCRLADLGEPCSTIVLPGRENLTWVVLTDARDHLPGGLVPAGTRVLPMFTRLPLPPSVVDGGVVRWHSEPDHARRWLPATATVLALAAPSVPDETRCARPSRRSDRRGRIRL